MEDENKVMRFKIKSLLADVVRPDVQPTIKAMKAIEDYSSEEFNVVGNPFGGPLSGRDSDGEAFHKDTDIWLKPGDIRPVTYYHGFGPDAPDTTQDVPQIIGYAKFREMTERGFEYDVRLDPDNELAQRILVDPTKARASSGAIGHVVRVSKGGMLDVWPVGELAMFDTNEWRLPANDFAVVEPKIIQTSEVAVETGKALLVKAATESEAISSIQEVNKMTPEELAEMREFIKSTVDESVKAGFETNRIVTPPAAILTGGAPAVVQSLGEPDEKAQTKAYLNYIRTGERPTKTAMTEASDPGGGYLVPGQQMNRIVAKRDEFSIARLSGAQVISSSQSVLHVPYEDTSHTNFSITAEAGSISEGEPTIGDLAITVYKFTKLVKVTEELLDDQQADLEGWLADAFGRAWALTENAYTVAGTGSGQPQGILYGGTAGKTFTGTAAITAAEVVALHHVLPAAYADGAVWTMRNATLGYLRGLTGSPFYFSPTPNGTTNSLDGAPVYLSDSMGIYSTTANQSMCIGNWNYYVLADRKSLTIRRLNELYAANGYVGLLATVRFGGGVSQAEAFQIGKQA
jgi:HK97 family phage major capsid protein